MNIADKPPKKKARDQMSILAMATALGWHFGGMEFGVGAMLFSTLVGTAFVSLWQQTRDSSEETV